jgi:hypothetical protein
MITLFPISEMPDPFVASGFTLTVAAGATLELAGSVSALGCTVHGLPVAGESEVGITVRPRRTAARATPEQQEARGDPFMPAADPAANGN